MISRIRMPDETRKSDWLPDDVRNDIEFGRVSVAPGIEFKKGEFFSTAQVGGRHYQSMTPQPFDVLRSWNLPHAEGEVIYHVIRHREKAGEEDLRKAISWLEMIIAHDYTATADKNEEGKPRCPEC